MPSFALYKFTLTAHQAAWLATEYCSSNRCHAYPGLPCVEIDSIRQDLPEAMKLRASGNAN